MSIHGHKVLNMMVGHSYTEAQLLDAVHREFGESAVFHTCSAQDMSAAQLIQLLKQKGKFMPTANTEFTVNQSAVCDHEHDHEHE